MVKNCQVLDNSSRLNSGRQFILAPYRLPTLVIKIGRHWNSASPSVCERSETGANGARVGKGNSELSAVGVAGKHKRPIKIINDGF